MPEAARTLALVEAKLGEDPRKSYLTGVWRARPKLVVHDAPPDDGEKTETARERDGLVEGEDISPSMEDLFDVSQGTPGRLPPVQRPATIEELIVIAEPYARLMLESGTAGDRQHNDIAGQAYLQFEAANGPPLFKRRMIALYNKATLRIGAVRGLDQVARAADELGEKMRRETEAAIARTMKAQEPIRERHAIINSKPGHPTKEERIAQYQAINAPALQALGALGPLLARYHQALEQEYRIRSSYMNGMLAHIGPGSLRTALTAEAEAVRFQMQVLQYGSALELTHLLGDMQDLAALRTEEGEAGKGPACTDEAAKWSAGVEVGVLGVEITCNSLSCELNAPVGPPFVFGSVELGVDTSGTVSIFAGPKVSVTGVGSLKEGLYITAGKDGVRDFGGKVEGKVSHGAGPLSVSQKVLDSSVSFVPGPDLGPAPGPMPTFSP